MQANKKTDLRKITVTAIMSALATVLMFLEFPIPFLIPEFVKFDFSELPGIVTSFALGPFWGVLVCLIKNVLHSFATKTMFIGEIANFIFGSIFVFVTGAIYNRKKSRKTALLGALIGDLVMAGLSWVVNVYFIYPQYIKKLGFPEVGIIGAYQAILPSVNSLKEAILIFNVPFTFAKGLACVIITFIIYPKISPILKGKKQK